MIYPDITLSLFRGRKFDHDEFEPIDEAGLTPEQI